MIYIFKKSLFKLGLRGGNWLIIRFWISLNVPFLSSAACQLARPEQQGLSFGSPGPCRRCAREGARGQPWRGGGDQPSVHSMRQPQHLVGRRESPVLLSRCLQPSQLLEGKSSKKGRFGSKKSQGMLNNEVFWSWLILSCFYLPSSFSDYATPGSHFQHFF